jgi:hypothetical protein
MDAFKVDLFALKNEGGTGSATVDLGRARRFLAWGSVTMVDPLTDFDRDNAVALDIFTVDGALTSSQVSGGDHWGTAGSSANVFDGAVAGFGQRISFFLRSIHSDDLDSFGVGIVLALDL